MNQENHDIKMYAAKDLKKEAVSQKRNTEGVKQLKELYSQGYFLLIFVKGSFLLWKGLIFELVFVNYIKLIIAKK